MEGFLLTEGIYTSDFMVKPIRRQIKGPKKTIYLILTSNKTPLGLLIQTVLDIPFSHIGISFEDNFSEVFAFGDDLDENHSGFLIEKMDRGVFTANDSDYVMLELDVTPKEYDRLKAEVRWFVHRHKEMKFNDIGLFVNAIGIPMNFKNRFFCSQFVAYVLEKSGVKLFDKNYGLVRPSDFLVHPDTRETHGGKVRDRIKSDKKRKMYKQTTFLDY